MANAIETLYKSLKTEYEPTIKVRYPYIYDDTQVPYIYMYEVDDPRIPNYLCDTTGGQSRLTIGYLSTRFADCVDKLDTIINFCNTLHGDYTGIEITQVFSGNTRDLTDMNNSQRRIYRREFDIILFWSK